MKCSACNGTGRYDNTGSPPCGSCKGTGEEGEGDFNVRMREGEVDINGEVSLIRVNEEYRIHQRGRQLTLVLSKPKHIVISGKLESLVINGVKYEMR